MLPIPQDYMEGSMKKNWNVSKVLFFKQIKLKPKKFLLWEWYPLFTLFLI